MTQCTDDEKYKLNKCGTCSFYKKMEKIREQVDAFYKTLTSSSDLISAAQSNPNVIVQNTGTFKPTDAIPGIGRDPQFLGAALSLKQDELSKAMKERILIIETKLEKR